MLHLPLLVLFQYLILFVCFSSNNPDSKPMPDHNTINPANSGNHEGKPATNLLKNLLNNFIAILAQLLLNDALGGSWRNVNHRLIGVCYCNIHSFLQQGHAQ